MAWRNNEVGFKSIISLLLKPIDFEMPQQPYSMGLSLSMSSLLKKFTRKSSDHLFQLFIVLETGSLPSRPLGTMVHKASLLPSTWYQRIFITILEPTIREHLCLQNYFLCSYLSSNPVDSFFSAAGSRWGRCRKNKIINKIK